VNRTLSEASEEYQRLTEGRYAPSTRMNRKGILARFIAKGPGDIQVRHLTQRHLEEYFYANPRGLTHVYQPRSVNLHRTTINCWFRFMQNRGWLTTDPLANVRPARENHRERVRLTAEELQRMLELCRHPRDRMFIALAINTGLRVSEIQSMKIADVNLDLGEIVVRIHKSFKEDTFPINADLDGELRRWIRFYQERVTLTPEHYLVPAKQAWMPDGSQGSVNMDPDSVVLLPHRPMGYPERLMNYLFGELGIPTAGEGVHTLRRSVARLFYDSMLEETGSRDDAIRTTQSLLHHASLVTTEHYLGMSRERSKRDSVLKGRPFLSAMAGANVVPLEVVGGDSADV
jgi:integrase